MSRKDSKNQNPSEGTGWSPLTALQNVIGPLADRLRRRRKRRGSEAPGTSAGPGMGVDTATPPAAFPAPEPGVRIEVEAPDVAGAFHEELRYAVPGRKGP